MRGTRQGKRINGSSNRRRFKQDIQTMIRAEMQGEKTEKGKTGKGEKGSDLNI